MASGMTPVTDPAILAQLNSGGGSNGFTPVTDSAILAQLNGNDDAGGTWDNIGNDWNNHISNMVKSQMYGVTGQQSMPETALQNMGDIAGGVFDMPTEVVKSAWGTAPQTIADSIDNTDSGKKLGDLLMKGSDKASEVAQEYPRATRDAQALANLLGLGGSGIPEAAAKTGSTIADTSLAAAKLPVKGVEVVKNTVAPLTESGRAKIAAQILAQNTNDPENAIAALKNAPEYIPQSYPTTGPASGDTGLLSLERTLRADPVNYFAQRIGEQNAARSATMNAVAGNEGDIANAIKARSTATSPLYENAANVPIAPNAFKPVLNDIDEAVQKAGPQSDLGKTLLSYKSKLQNSMPSMNPIDTGLVDETGAAITRPNFENAQSGPLSQIYREERDQLQKTGLQPGAYGASVKGIVKPINNQLGQVLEAQSPELANANKQFATRSKDINNMQNMQDLNTKMTGTTRDMAGNYMYEPARVERVMKAGGLNTDSGWQELGKALDTNQGKYLQNLQSDLARDNLLNSPQVKPSGSPTYSYTAGASGLNSQIGAMLERAPVVGKYIGNAYQNAADKVKAQLIAAMLDPNQAAQMLQSTIKK